MYEIIIVGVCAVVGVITVSIILAAVRKIQTEMRDLLRRIQFDN